MYRYSYNNKVYYYQQVDCKLQLQKYSKEWIDYIPNFDRVLENLELPLLQNEAELVSIDEITCIQPMTDDTYIKIRKIT